MATPSFDRACRTLIGRYVNFCNIIISRPLISFDVRREAVVSRSMGSKPAVSRI